MNFTTHNAQHTVNLKHNKLLLYLLLLLPFFVGFSQNINPINLSPGGVLETVFDQYGKQYYLSDLMIDDSNTPNTTYKTSLLTCSSTSYFNLYFEDGSGMETVTDPVQNATNSARRAVVCKVFEDISNFINSPLSNPGNTTKVNIWVRNINNVLTSPNGVLGLATSFYNLPSNTTKGGIADGEIWKTIHLGKDSYTNVAAPLSMTSTTSTLPGVFYHGMLALNFNTNNSIPISWCTTLTAPAPNGQYDLYSVVLHEVTHALGFVSLLDQNGKSKMGVNYKYYSRYDTFLKNNASTLPIIKTSSTLSGWYDNAFNTSLSTTVLRPNCTLTNFENTSTSSDTTLCNDALKYVGSTTASVYTPTCYESGSSFSHFEDQLYPTCASPYGNNNYFVMSNAQSASATNNTKRYLKPEEKAVLCDIGYSVKSSFGSSSVALTSTTFGPFNYSSGACGGITVAGINDGLNTSTSSYSFQGNVSSTPNITISGILSNDINATGFEGLEDLTASSTTYSVSTTSGSISTTITFGSTVAGVHLLRYVPTNGTQKGNITYIYVYVKELPATATANTCVPNSTICNLVRNGDFEQYSSLPTGISSATLKQISKVCGWNDAIINGTADYYRTNATVSTVQIPCNNRGSQACNTGGSGYIGLVYSSPGGVNNSESVYSQLSSPLVAGATYQLSFDISLADGNSSFGYGMQAFLSPTLLSVPISGNSVPTGVTILNETPSTVHSNFNGWDTVTFTYTATGGEQYIYLGGLQDVVATPLTPAPTVPGCIYNNYNGFSPSMKYSYYYLDNVKLIPTNGAVFNIPDSICSTGSISNLTDYLSSVVTNGVFSGPGVSYNTTTNIYSFNASMAGTGVKTISYTFTNNLNCSITLYDTINVLSVPITPTFASIPANICKMGAAPTLPTTSDNGITGTWSPSVVNTTVVGTFSFTFTPTPGLSCATLITRSIVIKKPTVPSFKSISDFLMNDGLVCEGSTSVPALPPVSTNGIPGTWSPSAINTSASGNYLFTPSLGQCASSTNIGILVLLNNAFVANSDTFVVTSGATSVTTGSVLTNDTYNGGSIPNFFPAGMTWGVVPVGTSPTSYITFNASTGVYTVAPNTPSGTYVFQYNITTNCYVGPTVTATIIVTPISTPVRLAFQFCYKNNGISSTLSIGGYGSLYEGSTINGLPIAPGTATITITSTPLPPITINNNDGTFTIAAGIFPQTINFNYSITCNGSTSASIRCDLSISSTLYAIDDNVAFNANGSGTYNVLSNDMYLSDCINNTIITPTTSNVTVMQVGSPNAYYSINTSNGNINVIGFNTPPPGTYVLSYQICDIIYPSICQTATVSITVPSSFAPTTNSTTSISKIIPPSNTNKDAISKTANNAINIPDPHFKAMLLAADVNNNIAETGPLNNLGSVKIDTNNDGEIQVSEVQNITYLLLLNSQISDLTGIEYFTNLIYLNIGQNSITTLDLSQLTQLVRLGCFQNNINSLNLNTLTHLQQLGCQQNQITSLNFSNNPELTTVYCGNNQISSLDFSANPLFNELGCRNNLLTSLNIKNDTTQLFGAQTLYNECWTGNPNLTTICADDTELPALQNFMSACGVNTSGMVINSSCSMANDEFMTDGVGVYPNPSNGVFEVEFAHGIVEKTSIVIYNVLGQEVKSLDCARDDKTMKVDLSDYPSGVYLVKIANGDVVLEKRILKK